MTVAFCDGGCYVTRARGDMPGGGDFSRICLRALSLSLRRRRRRCRRRRRNTRALAATNFQMLFFHADFCVTRNKLKRRHSANKTNISSSASRRLSASQRILASFASLANCSTARESHDRRTQRCRASSGCTFRRLLAEAKVRRCHPKHDSLTRLRRLVCRSPHSCSLRDVWRFEPKSRGSANE